MLNGVVVTVSDRCAAGSQQDRSGPILAAALHQSGYQVQTVLIPDGEEAVAQAIAQSVAAGARLVITSGGTGVGPRDRTPEGTRRAVDRELPGVAELLRAHGASLSNHAALSRGIAGVVDSTQGAPGAFVVNLPGSPDAAVESIGLVLKLAPHVLDQLSGGDHR